MTIHRALLRHPVRNALIVWACFIITVVVFRVTEPESFASTTAAGATVVTGVIGILATVLNFAIKRGERDR